MPALKLLPRRYIYIKMYGQTRKRDAQNQNCSKINLPGKAWNDAEVWVGICLPFDILLHLSDEPVQPDHPLPYIEFQPCSQPAARLQLRLDCPVLSYYDHGCKWYYGRVPSESSALQIGKRVNNALQMGCCMSHYLNPPQSCPKRWTLGFKLRVIACGRKSILMALFWYRPVFNCSKIVPVMTSETTFFASSTTIYNLLCYAWSHRYYDQ